jgi:hypothetical protein
VIQEQFGEPTGYFARGSNTFGNWFIFRGFLVNGDANPAVDGIKQHLRIYPLAQAANPLAMNFVNVSASSAIGSPCSIAVMQSGSLARSC